MTISWMSGVRWLAACVCLVAVCRGPATAQVRTGQEECRAAFMKGFALCEQGKYREALPHYERALELHLRFFGENNSNTATTRNNLATAH